MSKLQTSGAEKRASKLVEARRFETPLRNLKTRKRGSTYAETARRRTAMDSRAKRGRSEPSG
ncbi:MAG: hypothetical protein G01um101417_47 [Parcubacteria group bacterium Gr01-1014_17]|nr:MAG: hypothetical protein G01um101417_47 [Parcubacteria group bacterium Gr01-1014_17]